MTEAALGDAMSTAHAACAKVPGSHEAGCTATLAVLAPSRVVVAWCGDSKAILGRKVGNKYEARPLTSDHRPSDPEEMARIQECGGVVVKFDDPGSVESRVF